MFKALTAALLLAPAALASDPRAELVVGPLVGGEDVVFDLRTTLPNAPAVIVFGADPTPTVIGQLPAFGLDLASAFLFIVPTDGTGTLGVVLPTLPGQFGPAGQGLGLVFQALLEVPDGPRIVSNARFVELEPLPVAPDFLVENAASHLPAGYDDVAGEGAEAADIDRDGDLDLLIADGLEVLVWINDGDGVFADETATRITFTNDPVSTLAVGDIDNDGDPDLLTGGGYDDFVSIPDRLWLNDGDGVFTLSGALPEGEGLTSRFEVFDADNDGDLDVAVASGREGHLGVTGGKDQLYFNLGNLVLLPDPSFANATWNDDLTATNALRAGDVDGDGDQDLFVISSDTGAADGIPGQPNSLLLNDGLGEYTDASASHLLPLHSDNSQDASLVDLDLDGDLDLVVANSVLNVPSSSSSDVLWNQGGVQGGVEGVFVDDAASFLEPSTFADGVRLSVETPDIDVDGDPDVLVTVHDLFTGADQLLFLNQAGAFVKQAWFDPGDFVSYVGEAFDADSDGDQDLLLLANGVIFGDPQQQFLARFFENAQF